MRNKRVDAAITQCKRPIIWIPSLALISFLTTFGFWVDDRYAKSYELVNMECRISSVVNGNAQHIADIQSDTDLKKAKRDLDLLNLIPRAARGPSHKDAVDKAEDDKVFYMTISAEIRKEIEDLRKRTVADPCKREKK